VLSVPWRYASEGDRAQQVEQILVAIMTREEPCQEAKRMGDQPTRSPTHRGAGAIWQKMLQFSTKRLRMRGYASSWSRCQRRRVPERPYMLPPGAAAVRRAFRDATGAGSTEFLRRVRS
jgi:hypothetical protein